MPHSLEQPVAAGFSRQPGWEGGVLERVSFSVEIPLSGYRAKISELKAAVTVSAFEVPQWRGCYWTFPVLDPMGNTVDVYAMQPDGAEDLAWQE
jgi:hypothetical protein